MKNFTNKSILSAFLFLFILGNVSTAQWVKLKTGTPNNSYWYDWKYNDISFLNKDTGIVVGNFRMAYQTFDGGISWNKLEPALDTLSQDPFLTCQYVDRNTIYIGTYEYFLRSTDGGNSWVNINSNMVNVEAMDFISADTGYFAEGAGGFALTTDGGNTRTYYPYARFDMAEAVVLQVLKNTRTDSTYIYLIGNQYFTGDDYVQFNYSHDGGENWNNVWNSGMPVSGIGLNMFDGLNGYLIVEDLLLKTTDGWSTYSVVPLDSIFNIMNAHSLWARNKLCFVSPDTGFILNDYGNVYETLNGGISLKYMTSGPNKEELHVRKIVCPDDNTCFAIGWMPDVFRFDFDSSFTLPSGMAQIEINNELRAMPNPSTGYFTLHLPITKGVATLKVYDLSGRVLWQRKYANQASSTVSLDLSGTPPGLYLIEWQTEDQSYFGKLMIE